MTVSAPFRVIPGDQTAISRPHFGADQFMDASLVRISSSSFAGIAVEARFCEML